MDDKELLGKLEKFTRLTEMGVMLHPYFTGGKSLTARVENIKKYWDIYIKNTPDAFVTIYVNIPYCRKNKCRYCMYNSKILKAPSEISGYVDYLIGSMESFSGIFKNIRIAALYIGGGTPTLLEPNDLSRMLAALRSLYAFRDNAPMTYEVSPSSVNEEKLRVARERGINRISVGVQSTDEETLKLARRPRVPPERLGGIVNMINELGFEELNMDLIRGLPGDTYEGLAKSFADVAALRPTSITVYSFRLENTRYPEKLKSRYAHLHESEYMAGMYDTIIREARRSGFKPLESNPMVIAQKFLRIDCNPKLAGFPTVWVPQLGNSCLGIGVGARSFIVDAMGFTEIGPYGLGRGNICGALDGDMRFDKTNYIVTVEPLEGRMRNYFLQRLYERGWISIPEFEDIYGKNPLEVFAPGIRALERLGKMEVRDDKIFMKVANEFEYGVYSKFFLDEEALGKAFRTRFGENAYAS